MAIRYVIDTHVHADHHSTGRALADAAGAPYVLDEEAFVAAMVRDIPPPPANAATIRAANLGLAVTGA